MVKPMIMEEILALKESGHSIQEVIAHFEGKGLKAPSRPTLRKYCQMNAVPEDLVAKLAKDKAFDQPMLREVIIKIIRNCKGKYNISSVYDMLEERFASTGEYERLPGSEQTLRNYARHLKKTIVIDTVPNNHRIYDHVFETAPGEQLLLDFGEMRFEGGKQVHFICLLLRCSRLFCVYAQDHKYNAEEACRDIYRSFRKFGGGPRQFAIDQDAVFVVSETYGEVVETRVFKDFFSEQDIKLRVCNKADPESKGGVENLAGFVKKNYFSARNIKCVEDVWETLPGRVERKGRRIRQAAHCIPIEVFEAIEQKALRPIAPSVYENLPSSYTRASVSSTPHALYKSCKHSVPREYCFKTARCKAAADKIHICGDQRKYICTHAISGRKGAFIQLDEHKKLPPEDWKPAAERLRAKWNCPDFQHFIIGFKKENPRHLCTQLIQVEGFLDAENPSKELVGDVMGRCCEGLRYKHTQFKQVCFLAKGGYAAPETITMANVSQHGMDACQKAFNDRCER
ncbi:MAG: hypothetical protein LBU32_10550 [Clostridiales bacterium]|jgi:transposase|nr:hypothetical protein [Clostridiales bacterium]